MSEKPYGIKVKINGPSGWTRGKPRDVSQDAWVDEQLSSGRSGMVWAALFVLVLVSVLAGVIYFLLREPELPGVTSPPTATNEIVTGNAQTESLGSPGDTEVLNQDSTANVIRREEVVPPQENTEPTPLENDPTSTAGLESAAPESAETDQYMQAITEELERSATGSQDSGKSLIEGSTAGSEENQGLGVEQVNEGAAPTGAAGEDNLAIEPVGEAPMGAEQGMESSFEAEAPTEEAVAQGVTWPETLGTAPAGGEPTLTADESETIPLSDSAEQDASGVVAEGSIARAQLTTGIDAREPIDAVDSFTLAEGEASKVIYYFTEIRGLTGETVTHSWQREGETMAEVSFDIGGPRWRVYSSKTVTHDMLGEWQMMITDSQGNLIKSTNFTLLAGE